MVESIIADVANYNGLDQYGTKWFSKIMPDGKQVWADVRDCKIRMEKKLRSMKAFVQCVSF